ncbi:hypothetical protein D3C73_1446970 [compost metagenome]
MNRPDSLIVQRLWNNQPQILVDHQLLHNLRMLNRPVYKGSVHGMLQNRFDQIARPSDLQMYLNVWITFPVSG